LDGGGGVTENEARVALSALDGVGGLERWIAEQRWERAPDGWRVPGELQGWRFRVEPVPGGVRVTASAGGGSPAVWGIPAGPKRASP
jgi:hypothetical protein